MRVFDEKKIRELYYYDLENGYLKPDKLFVRHHEAVAPTEQVLGYKEKRYANGGVSRRPYVISEAQKGTPAWDEYEDISVYIPYTQSQLAEKEIAELKAKLQETDYKAIKFAEGVMSEEEYLPIRIQRQEWRSRINYLEDTL